MAHWYIRAHVLDDDGIDLLYACSACGCESHAASCYCPDCGVKMENGIKLEVAK